jgi:SMC interacting uncharacterized protein involved in chromosome segregation
MSKQTTELDLIERLAAADKDVQIAQAKMVKMRQLFWEAETELMGLQLKKEDLQQQLRKARMTIVDLEQTPEEKEIAEFAERLPELLKRV